MLWGYLLNAQQDSIVYSFLVAGHTYGEAGVDNPGLHPPFKDRFGYIQNREEIQFGFFTGDIVSANPTAQDWDEVDDDVDSLGIPVYFVAGNHDIEDRPLYESRYGSTYYQFIKEKALFMVLDANIDGWSIKGDQLEFLKTTLKEKADSVDHIFVFFHQVLWTTESSKYAYIGINSAAGKIEPVNFWDTIMPLFQYLPKPVFMFAGDLGAGDWSSDVAYDQFGNISFIASGMGSGEGDNFIVVNVMSNGSIDYDLICLDTTNTFCLGDLIDYRITTEEDAKRIYPNPTNDFVNIEIEPWDSTIIEIVSMQGQLMETHYSNGNYFYKMDVSHLKSGTYFLYVKSTDSFRIERLVKL